MSKKPYIPIYIGDLLKDWGHLPLDVFGAAHKLLYKMWDSKQKGKICLSFASYKMMLGASDSDTERIILELTRGDDPIFDREDSNGFIKLINRRMVRESAISEIRSQSGSKGGKTTQSKTEQKNNFDYDLLEKNKSKNQSNQEAKAKQNSDNDIDNEYVIDNDIKGGAGGKWSFENSDPETKAPVALMAKVWMNYQPEYPLMETNDFPALRKIQNSIALIEKFETPMLPHQESAMLEIWERIASHVSKHNHFARYNLAQVEKYIQSIVQDIKFGAGKGKPAATSKVQRAFDAVGEAIEIYDAMNSGQDGE